MTCIPIPDGIICVGSPVIKLGKYHFEMHRYCGPMRCNKYGDGLKTAFPKEFWPLFEAWLKENPQS